MDLIERLKNYKEPHCYQYQMRLDNLDNDLKELNMTLEESKLLRVSDFYFESVDMADSKAKKECFNFIVKNEYLGNLTHRLLRKVARYICHRSNGCGIKCLLKLSVAKF